MQCTQCSASIPFDPDIGAATNCLFCKGMQVATASQILNTPSIGFTKEKREAQVRLTQLIEDSIKKEMNAVIEAGTGVGKSFAYLLPAVLSGERTIISTAKKSLQSQLLEKDLPYIKTKLQDLDIPQGDFKFEGAYGKGNYGCRARVVRKAPKRLKEWDFYFFNVSDTWHRDDLPKGKKLYITKELSAEHCLGTKCAQFPTCRYIATKKRMMGADIIVTNHWMLGFDLAAQASNESGQGILGDYDRVVIDEAHKIEEGVRAAFTHKLPYSTLERMFDAYDILSNATPGDHVFRSAMVLEKTWKRIFNSAKTEGAIAIDRADAFVMMQSLSPQKLALRIKECGDKRVTTEQTEYVVFMSAANEIYAALDNSVHNANNYVTYVEMDGTKKTISTAPINIGPQIQGLCDKVPTTFVSATLAVGGSLTRFQRRYRIDKSKRGTKSAQYGSAFDLDRQSILYLSTKVSVPTRREPAVDTYREELTSEIDQLLCASAGNAFVLFTARDEMQHVFQALENKHPIICQGAYSPADALATYRTTPNSVLFGLKSFWEGVDVQGDKLRLVIITKLPFPGKSDPIANARRSEAGESWFQTIDLPDMIIDLRQGVGRLIRSKTDRGVVALLDNRLHTKTYRRTVLRSLGMNRATTNTKAVLKALGNLSSRHA